MKKNWYTIGIIAAGVLLFAIVVFVIQRNSSTVNAIMPNQEIPAGVRITEEMIQMVEVPAKTPEGFVTDKSTLIGQKLKTSVSPEQFIYVNNVITSWDDFIYGVEIPEDYIITSIQLPSDRAVGGLITAGDHVDILGVPDTSYAKETPANMRNYLGSIADSFYGAKGSGVYWVMSNVIILETDSTLASNDKNAISQVIQSSDETQTGSYYIVALSYADYQKLRFSEIYLDLWMNIAPEWNYENDPLIPSMNQGYIRELRNSQAMSILESAGKQKDGTETFAPNYRSNMPKVDKYNNIITEDYLILKPGTSEQVGVVDETGKLVYTDAYLEEIGAEELQNPTAMGNDVPSVSDSSVENVQDVTDALNADVENITGGN